MSDRGRQLALVEDELRLTNVKLHRVLQEKAGMERDSRAAIHLARRLDNNNSNDMNYYKRKVSELARRHCEAGEHHFLDARAEHVRPKSNTHKLLIGGG